MKKQKMPFKLTWKWKQNNWRRLWENLKETNIRDSFAKKMVSDLEEVIMSDNTIVLYYIYPLVERLVIETLSMEMDFNIEKEEQGIFRTIGGVLEDAHNATLLKRKLGDKLLIALKRHYIEGDPPRNLVLKETNFINDRRIIDEAKYLALLLLEHYISISNEYHPLKNIQPLT